MYRYDYRINGTNKMFNCTPQYMHYREPQSR